MGPHRRQIASDMVGPRVPHPISDEWPIVISPRRVTRLQLEDDSSRLGYPFPERSYRSIRHQEDCRFPSRGRWNIQLSLYLDPRLTFEPDVQATNILNIRLLQHFHFRSGAFRWDLQPAQLSLQLRYCSLPFPGAKIVKDQLIDFPATWFILDVAARCYQKFEVRIEVYRLFVKITLAVFEPANHPFIDGFSSLERHAVRSRPDEKAHLVFSAVEAVPMSGLLIHWLGGIGREEVTLGRQNDPRLWGG